MTDDVEGKPPPGIPPTAPPPSADPPGGAPPPPPWVRPGRTALTPVRPVVLVGAIIAAVLVVIVTVAIVGNTGSHPVAAASPSTTPMVGPPLPPPNTMSGGSSTSAVPQPPDTNPVGGLDPSLVFAGRIAPDGGVVLDEVMVHHGEGCAVHIDNSGVRDTFQRWNCGSVISATYATADHQVLAGALVFPFPDVYSAAGAAGSLDPAREARARAFAPLNPSPGPGRMPVPRLTVKTEGSYLIVIVAWHQDGRDGSQSDDQLSVDSAPLLSDVDNRLAALQS